MAYPSDLTRTKNWGTEVLTDSDLEGQLDLIINWAMASLDATSGHDHSAVANKSPKIDVATSLKVTSQAQGDILYASSAVTFARLGYGTKGKCLTTGGAAANPSWEGMTTQGDVEYHDGTSRARLGAGTSGQFLQTKGAGANPVWAWSKVVQVVNTQTGTSATGTTQIPLDNTVPQNTEGDERMTLAITPTSATNKLIIDVVVSVAHGTTSRVVTAALFQDSTASALAAMPKYIGNNNAGCGEIITFRHYMTSGTTSSTTFKVRIGANDTGNTIFNVGSYFNGLIPSSITIYEVSV